ncbi:MAG: NACHT domain-containing protein, partial [Leptolyngbyaceae cyanobacterium RM1_1_2]|nr:NACHT domain-containing protein [Leptolyngbyaceae cyanobacterium RM1_1_2]
MRSILDDEDYLEWQEFYTPTTVEGRKESAQAKFSRRLKLRAETVKPSPEKPGSGEAGQPDQPEQGGQWDVLAGLRNYAAEHVLLIGIPGSGKSSSLERLLWEEADNALKNPDAQIPVLVKLRRCTSSIAALIQDFLIGHQCPLDIKDIDYCLQQGKFLLLLDGLNELPEPFTIEAANFRNRYRRTTPMVVSTRDLSVGGTLNIKKTLKMLPLTGPQMQEFVRGYLGEAGKQLFQQLKGDDRLRKFAETPLLLWMLCRVFAEKSRVPANLGLAFREFTQLYDDAIQEDAPADARDQWPKLLRHLAFALMHDQRPTDFRLSMPREEAKNLLTECLQEEGRTNARGCAEKWLKELLDYHLIQPVIQPTFEEHIEFRHQLIQEYYAAEYLLRRLPNLTDDQLKRDYLNYLKWTEPIALMLALVDEEAQALRVVKLAIDDVDLILGARLAGEVKAGFHVQTIKFLEDLEVPDWLKVQLLGETRSDFVLNELRKVLQDKNHYHDMRKRAAFALIKLGSDNALKAIRELKNKDLDTYRSVVFRNPDLEPNFSEFLRFLKNNESDSLHIAKEKLEEIGSAILGLLEESDHHVFKSTVDTSRRLVAEGITKEIKKLENPDEKVRRSVADTLGNSKAEEAIPALSKVLKEDSSWEVRRSAASALGQIGSK